MALEDRWSRCQSFSFRTAKVLGGSIFHPTTNKSTLFASSLPSPCWETHTVKVESVSEANYSRILQDSAALTGASDHVATLFCVLAGAPLVLRFCDRIFVLLHLQLALQGFFEDPRTSNQCIAVLIIKMPWMTLPLACALSNNTILYLLFWRPPDCIDV